MASVRITLPSRSRGRPTEESISLHRQELLAFCEGLEEIASRLDFAPSTRGWCYVLEEYGLSKGDFDRAEIVISDCRKRGLLLLGISGEDVNRETVGIEKIDEEDPEIHAKEKLESYIDWFIKTYRRIDFWDSQKYYVEMVVEKIDLKNLFAPVCAEYHVPLTNLKGWSDIWSRARLMQRFKEREEAGKQCVLLVCVDHDPGGLKIADSIRANLAEITTMEVDWSPENLEIVRFGLTYEFIEQHGLTWIENLTTASGKSLDDPSHFHHNAPHVQEYIERFGVRKCEANALIVRPEAGRQLCRDAIQPYINQSQLIAYTKALKKAQRELRRVFPEALREYADEMEG